MQVMTVTVIIFMGSTRTAIIVMGIIEMDMMKMDLMFTAMTKLVLTVMAIIAMDMTAMDIILKVITPRVS